MPASPLRLLLLAALAATLGCQSALKQQVAALQVQNGSLCEENESLRLQNEQLNTALREAEQLHAELQDELSYVLAENRQRELDSPHGSARLDELARRYENLRYDPATGACHYDAEIQFDTGKAHLRPSSKRALDELVDVLRDEGATHLRLVVVGHTDDKRVARLPGRKVWPNNLHLSSSRAAAVADYLTASGVPGEQIAVQGHGQYQPVASNTLSDARQKNRRVEIYLVDQAADLVGWRGGPRRTSYR